MVRKGEKRNLILKLNAITECSFSDRMLKFLISLAEIYFSSVSSLIKACINLRWRG